MKKARTGAAKDDDGSDMFPPVGLPARRVKRAEKLNQFSLAITEILPLRSMIANLISSSRSMP